MKKSPWQKFWICLNISQKKFGVHTTKTEKSNLKNRPYPKPLRKSLRVWGRAVLTSDWCIAKIVFQKEFWHELLNKFSQKWNNVTLKIFKKNFPNLKKCFPASTGNANRSYKSRKNWLRHLYKACKFLWRRRKPTFVSSTISQQTC